MNAELATRGGPFTAVGTFAVRDLGPVLKPLSSAALVEGGTEAMLHVTSRPLLLAGKPRAAGLR